MIASKTKVGIALSGGGAKGVCHLGMMEALLENEFRFDVISGTSAGSLIGALYANGYTPKEILDIFINTDFPKLAGFAMNWNGLLNIRKASELLAQYLPKTFDDLKHPFIATCTSMDRNKAIYFHEGPLLKVLLASCSIPVVFEPVEINGEQFVDGGVLDNLPIKPLKDRDVDFTIGLHCNSIGEGSKAKNWRELMFRSLEMAISSATFEKKNQVDIFMEAPQMVNFEVFDFEKAQKMFDIGYTYATAYLEDIVLPKKGLFNKFFDKKVE